MNYYKYCLKISLKLSVDISLFFSKGSHKTNKTNFSIIIIYIIYWFLVQTFEKRPIERDLYLLRLSKTLFAKCTP